ncbi:MAG TPA: hypothetical protein VMZ28_15335, partial [Kofleriaceae bacterium]|nr:hypothetical protein [Kofleriaceae bacterium]
MGVARSIAWVALVLCVLVAWARGARGDEWVSWDELEMEEPGEAEAVATALAAELMAAARAEYAQALAASSGTALAKVRELDRKLEEAMAAAGFQIAVGTGSGSGGSGSGTGHAGGFGAAVDLQGLLLGGLLQFVERRASDEAVHWVLRLLRTRLCDEGVGTRALFPATCGLLDGLALVASEMSPLSLLRDAVRRDLSEMPEHMLKVAAALGPGGASFRCGLGLSVLADHLIARGADAEKITAAVGAVLRVEDCARASGLATRADADRAAAALRPALHLVAAVLVEAGAASVERDSLAALDKAARAPLLPDSVTEEASVVEEEANALRLLVDAVVEAD